jgi:hypothetical protein
MQVLVVVGNEPPNMVTRGEARALREVHMFDDPRSDDTRDRDDWREREMTRSTASAPIRAMCLLKG